MIDFESTEWLPTTSDIIASLVTSAITGLIVFIITTQFLSAPISPTTEHEVSLVAAYPSGDDELTVVVENTGDFPEEDIQVFLEGRDYERSANIASLSTGQDVSLQFDLLEPEIREFERHNSTTYLIENRTRARRFCNELSDGESRELPPENEVIRLTKEHVSGEFVIPESYRVGVKHKNARDQTIRSSITYPHSYTLREESRQSVIRVPVRKEEGICYYNDFALFWLVERGGKYIDYAPKGNSNSMSEYEGSIG
jgi:hypothetical protein